MKVGDLVKYNPGFSNLDGLVTLGTIIEFPPASHPKEFQKVRVLAEDGTLHTWVLQFCEVIS